MPGQSVPCGIGRATYRACLRPLSRWPTIGGVRGNRGAVAPAGWLRNSEGVDSTMVYMRQMGARVRRKEDPRLITGSSTYVDDFRPSDIGHVAILRSIYG